VHGVIHSRPADLAEGDALARLPSGNDDAPPLGGLKAGQVHCTVPCWLVCGR
jgi:hypothetical protein